MKRSAIYPGTFDPFTLGHLDVMTRAADVFERLVVAVARFPNKDTWFNIDERMDMIRQSASGIDNVEVVPFEGLLVDFARNRGIHVLVRGLRAYSDFEYEFQIALTNRKLAPDVETLFLMTSDTYSYVSSSAVREVAGLGGDTSKLVPDVVNSALKKRMKNKKSQ